MVMARLSPSKCKLSIIDESALLETEEDSLCDVIFYATGLEMSEKLALTLCSRYKCVERNCVSNFVRVRALASLNLCKLQ
jgi:hypothetical protein